MNTRARVAILILSLGAVLGAGQAEAHLRPSTELLLPYFEVDLGAGGVTTLLGLTNSFDQPISAVATVYSNWGIKVLEVPLNFGPRQVQSADLRDWIAGGKLPSGSLAAADLAELQAELSGKASPKDGLYYASTVASGRAAGYVIVRVTGGVAPPAGLWGESFSIDSGSDVAWGGPLVDISAAVGCPDLCSRHAVRFLSGAAFDAGTQVVIWTPRQGQPSAQAAYPASALVQGTARLYDETGRSAGEHAMGLLPVERVAVADLGATAQPGWIDLVLETGAFVGVRDDAHAHYSIALETYCLEEATPSLSLRKVTNGSHDDVPPGFSIPVGAAVSWKYVVTNTGQVPLTGVAVSDDQGVAVKCPQTTLDPGEQMICSGVGVAVACQYHNVGSAVATTPGGPELVAQDDGYYFGDPGAAISVALSTDGKRASAPPGPVVQAGSKMTWTYLVTNTGHVALSSVGVQDDHGVAVSCPRTSLAPGAAMTCTATGTAVAGQYHNVGTATGAGPCGAVRAHDDGYYQATGAPPGLSLKKSTNGQHPTCAPGPSLPVGSAVTWSYVVTNTGGVALSSVHVTDDQGVAVSCPQSTLQPGEAMTCSGSGTAAACQYHNTGTAYGTSPAGTGVSAHDQSWYFGTSHPAIAIKKYTNGQRVTAAPGPTIAVGSAVTWTYAVTNTGDAPLASVHVTDDQNVAVSCPQSALQPGQTMTCSGQGTAVAGQYHNVGTATGQPSCGSAVSASDASWYSGQNTPPPGLSLKKSTNGQHPTCAPGPSLPVGSAVTWSYVVTNTGGVALSSVHVTDDQGVAVSCPQSTLQPGQAMTCSGSGTAVACQYHNTGTAYGTSPAGTGVSAHDQSWYFGSSHPAIAIKKYTNGQRATAAPGPTIAVGAAVTWTYEVTNTGDAPLASVHVTDDQNVAVACPQSALQPGQTMTCSGHGTAVSGQYHNVGTATGQPPCGSAVSASDSSWYSGQGGSSGCDGCSPGYWKTHPYSWPSPYATGQTLASVWSQASHFPSLASSTLLQGLAFEGGSGADGAARTLLRSAVAAILNAVDPQIHYTRQSAQVISDVNAALAGGHRDDMLALASQLDTDNNASCPHH